MKHHPLLREFQLFFRSLLKIISQICSSVRSLPLFKNYSLLVHQPHHQSPLGHHVVWYKDTNLLLSFLFVIFTGYFTYVTHYEQPNAPFWDEPYHIASAQKYLHRTFFMEQHPPLGKLFIALGEYLLHPNINTDQFLKTDYASTFTADASFAGYRLFPTLFGWGSTILLFFIFLTLTKNSILSALLTFPLLFDNAQIVHARGAMLEPTLAFFSLLTILFFFLLSKNNDTTKRSVHYCLSILFGISFACAIGTKVVALVLVLLPLLLIFRFGKSWKKSVSFLMLSGTSFLMIYSAIWSIHFRLGTTIEPSLPDQGYYQASDSYKTILQNKETNRWRSFPVMLKDSLKFVNHYNNGVPKLDLCKADENGSPSFFWPFGARTINYRWAKVESGVQYLYLVPNPFGWALGFFGVVFTAFLCFGLMFGERKNAPYELFSMLSIALLYVGYMVAISQIDRVMYLYHYFLPLLFSYILFGLSIMNIHQFYKWTIDMERRILLVTIIGLLTFASFQWFRPFSYYLPMKSEAVMKRAIFPLWELTCVDCEKVSPLVRTRGN